MSYIVMKILHQSITGQELATRLNAMEEQGYEFVCFVPPHAPLTECASYGIFRMVPNIDAQLEEAINKLKGALDDVAAEGM